jgi:hypothetical protein
VNNLKKPTERLAFLYLPLMMILSKPVGLRDKTKSGDGKKEKNV